MAIQSDNEKKQKNISTPWLQRNIIPITSVADIDDTSSDSESDDDLRNNMSSSESDGTDDNRKVKKERKNQNVSYSLI